MAPRPPRQAVRGWRRCRVASTYGTSSDSPINAAGNLMRSSMSGNSRPPAIGVDQQAAAIVGLAHLERKIERGMLGHVLKRLQVPIAGQQHLGGFHQFVRIGDFQRHAAVDHLGRFQQVLDVGEFDIDFAPFFGLVQGADGRNSVFLQHGQRISLRFVLDRERAGRNQSRVAAPIVVDILQRLAVVGLEQVRHTISSALSLQSPKRR